ncbi:hypothetical protein O6H91_08G117000 [Diphasiastrum complanatum]|uniref:Uncharacterized protein n=2 Tax=Diphasiastrum complanatum TaxID=34168 RepID=A0ACC2D1J5_DIPCM|nr:hypothetical protein O6H91_08G117000 [Diphasiastrum complanatum]
MLSSAAEFVEGGVQDPCEDACSICLEAFCAEDPASITSCNHAYHLQCILEWAQRSSECPMCWQSLVMKDAVGQELLSSAEHERSLRSNQIQASFLPYFRSEDHELDHFASFEERLMQHLAAATAGQAHGRGRRDHFRPTSTGGHPRQFLFFRPNTNADSTASDTLDSSVNINTASSWRPGVVEQGEAGLEEGQLVSNHGLSPIAVAATSAGSVTQGASTSELQSFSEAIKSRLAAASSKYKDTLAKTTRMLREKMRARNVASSNTGGVRSRDVSTGVIQALGQISLESAGQRKDPDETHAYSSAKQAQIVDKKQVGGESLDEDKPAISIP